MILLKRLQKKKKHPFFMAYKGILELGFEKGQMNHMISLRVFISDL